MDKFVWLCTARNDAEAGMIQGVLENEGLLVQLRSHGVGRAYGMNNFHGVEIQVPEGDKHRAQELLHAYFPEAPADIDNDAID